VIIILSSVDSALKNKFLNYSIKVSLRKKSYLSRSLIFCIFCINCLILPIHVAAQEIQIGISAPFSGPASALGLGMKSGIESYFKRVNSSGGIKGHKLRLIAFDDGYDPSSAADNMRKLIDKENVIALIGNVGTPTAMVTVPIANKEKTLLFGAFTGAEVLRKSPPDRYVINYRASYAEETAAMVNAILQSGIRPKEIAFFTQNDSYGNSGYKGAIEELKKQGFANPESLVHGRFKRNTLNIDDALKTILTAKPKPKAIIMVGTYMPCARFIKRVEKYLPDTIFLNVSFVGSVALAKALGGAGEGVIVTQVTPHFESDLPGVKEYRQDLENYSASRSGLSSALKPNFISLEGYIAAKLFVEGLKRVDSELTRESVINGIEKIRNQDIGLGFKISYSKKEHQGSHNVWPTIIKQGEIVPIEWSDIKSRVSKKLP